MRSTAIVWRMRPPVPRELAGWYLPDVAAGMVQKQAGAASSVRFTSLRMPAWWIRLV